MGGYMTKLQQENLIKYGSSINVLVTPKVIEGELAVAYRDSETRSADRAHYDLLQYTLEIAA